MNLPKQPLNQKIFKYSITSLIILASLWSAAGLEITLDRIINAPKQIGILVGAMFPLDLSQEAFSRIIPKVFESLFIAWAGTVIGSFFSFLYRSSLRITLLKEL
jgi:ABC-type phosphate/phosphonate transport system permease subunit